jgi:alkanesulfonate monooxygenase SsuD/methylene tetrahydromethanopterin reductase-like flavin-dependent oxidoreductase (luciferase family)
MDIGIGLPSTIPGIPGRLVARWATAAERAGFSTLGTIDRVVYPSLETIPTLAAAAAVTERIGLTTAILIAPYRGNGALLAKQLATVDSIAGGRLTVGIAVGGRADDYEATAAPFEERGRAFDAQLAEMHAVWSGEPRGFAGPIGPRPMPRPGATLMPGPPLLIGGNAPATFRRMTKYGAGWISGGGGPELFAAGAERARRAWQDAGRDGAPRLACNAYVSLGSGAEAHARQYLGDY